MTCASRTNTAKSNPLPALGVKLEIVYSVLGPHKVAPLKKGQVEVNGTCKDCRKRFTRTSKIGGNVPVYCMPCERK
jgi:hypothetical protein